MVYLSNNKLRKNKNFVFILYGLMKHLTAINHFWTLYLDAFGIYVTRIQRFYFAFINRPTSNGADLEELNSLPPSTLIKPPNKSNTHILVLLVPFLIEENQLRAGYVFILPCFLQRLVKFVKR